MPSILAGRDCDLVGGDMIKAKPNKYRNTRCKDADGNTFDSKGEMRRFHILRLMEKQGEIAKLRRQVRYPLHTRNNERVGYYVADFEYIENGEVITEDFKSPATEKDKLFVWKRRHFEHEYEREIRIT